MNTDPHEPTTEEIQAAWDAAVTAFAGVIDAINQAAKATAKILTDLAEQLRAEQTQADYVLMDGTTPTDTPTDTEEPTE